MPLLIGDKKLIPAPLVNIAKQTIFANDGSPLNSSYSISIVGTILPTKGSPLSNGWYGGIGEPPSESFTSDEDRFNSILSKQELLREAFSATGYKVTYSSPGMEPIEFYPKLNSIRFEQGTWVIKSDYSIELDAPSVNKVNSDIDVIEYGSGYIGKNLTSVTDDYSIREREDGRSILEVNRTLSATAAFMSGPSGVLAPWEHARNWVTFRKNNFPFTTYFNTVSSGLAGSGYNYVEEESINQLAGQYSLTQRFIFNPQNYIDTRTINRQIQPSLLGDGGARIERITVQGNIEGLDINNSPSGKWIAASSYFTGMSGTLGSLVGANGNYISSSINENRNAGTIDYTFDFINNSGQFYTHNYDVNYVIGSNDLPLVTIQGNIEGYTPDSLYSGVGSNYTKFDNALSGWNAISPTLKTLAFAYNLVATGTLFSDNPLSRNISYNKANGTVNYNYVFAYTSGASVNYQHSYTINLNSENGPANIARAGLNCTATIDGQIIGVSSGDNPNNKLANARTGWNALQTNLYTLVNNEYSLLGSNTPVLNSGVVRKVINVNTSQGSIGYSLAYNNLPAPSSNLVAIEDMAVEDVNPSHIFAIQNIPGRSIGPIIQNIGTISEKRRNINVTLTMLPKGSAPYYWSYTDKSTPSNIASGLITTVLPAGTGTIDFWLAGDSENWNPKAGLYTRSVNIVY